MSTIDCVRSMPSDTLKVRGYSVVHLGGGGGRGGNTGLIISHDDNILAGGSKVGE